MYNHNYKNLHFLTLILYLFFSKMQANLSNFTKLLQKFIILLILRKNAQISRKNEVIKSILRRFYKKYIYLYK